MDGKTLRRSLAYLINEDPDTSGYMNTRVSYEYLWDAAIEMAQRTSYLTARASLTSVVDTSEYDLPSDFLGLYMRDAYKRLFIQYNDGSNDYYITWRDEESVFYNNQTTSISVPGNFYVNDSDMDTETDTGMATSTAASANGQCTLTDTTATFITTGVSAGDTIHNTTDGSTGIVLAVTTNTVLECALFGGTDNDWTSGDAYTIVMQPRLKLVLDHPSSTAGHTMTVPYIQRPAPVFSDLGRYRFPSQWSDALVRYAAWKYKYRDDDLQTGDKWYVFWDTKMKQLARQGKVQKNRRGYKMVMKA